MLPEASLSISSMYSSEAFESGTATRGGGGRRIRERHVSAVVRTGVEAGAVCEHALRSERISLRSCLSMKPSRFWSIMLNASLNSAICFWSNMANTFEVPRAARRRLSFARRAAYASRHRARGAETTAH